MKSLNKYITEKLVIFPSQVNEKLVIFPSQVNEKLVIFPSQVNEKLVINKDFADIEFYNSKMLYELYFLWDDFYKRVLYIYVHDVDEIISNHKDSIILKFKDSSWPGHNRDVTAKSDDGLQLFYRKIFTQDGYVRTLYLTDEYKDIFIDLCENFLKNNKHCTAKEIFDKLGITFTGEVKEITDSIYKDDKKFYISQETLNGAINKLHKK